jgi:DNA-binding XRE family transcriptional regulator
MDKIQIIRDAKGEAVFAVVPWNEYERLRAGDSEDAQLIKLANAARGEESFPASVAKRLVAGESPLKAIREWRGLTQSELGKKSGVAVQYISQMERGARNMGRKVAGKLAKTLRVSAEALLE